MHHIAVVVVVALAACAPRMSVGYDASAHTRGPLANLQTIPRITAVTGAPAPAPPEGTNYALAVGFGDKNFHLGARVNANNISGSTLDIMNGPQYVSAAASLDFRYSYLRFKHLSANVLLAPSRTALLDSTSGDYSWGSGVRYGGGLAVSLSKFMIYADAYQDQMVFVDGPAQGHSTRTGVTVGLAFQP